MDEGKAADVKAPKRRRAAWWVEILIAIAVVLVVVGIAIPAYNTHKTNAKLYEAKSNLRQIQLGIERYGVDNDVKYPAYLIGGSAPSTGSKDASDPLIRGGYLASYPKNPFAPMVNVSEIQKKYSDPLRPGGEGSKFGFRFGEDCTLMGNVLADVRFPGKYAEFGYPFYDLWPKGKRHPNEYIPGAFFYRSTPTLVSAKKLSGEQPKSQFRDPEMYGSLWSSTAYAKRAPWVPEGGPEMYILGLYGPPNDRGKDMLGEPQEIAYYYPLYDEVKRVGVMAYIFSDPNTVTPYGSQINLDPPPPNPNGIPDCIVFYLYGPMDS
jgi:hypothetical protein